MQHTAGVDLDEEEHVEAPEQHGVHGEEVAGNIDDDWCRRNSAQVEPARLGDGSTPWRRTIAQTLEGASRIRIVASSPWILRYLQVGFSLAN
jgi:hypothetical protein